MINPIILSVRLMTYNHAEYITQCLNSIEQQQTSFPFEVIIGDDFSTDNNIALIQQFIASSTNKNINYILLDRKKGDEYDINRQIKGRLYNFLDMISHCKGKYIALLDGDDYWTDPYKLQKQVDFLETHKEYGICAHVATTKDHFNQNNNNSFPNLNENKNYTIEDFIIANYTATASLVFKRKIFQLQDWHIKSPFGDWLLILSVMKNSNNKIFVLKDNMSVYRIHEGGIHGNLHQNNLGLVTAYQQHLKFINLVELNLFQKSFKKAILIKRINTYKIIYNLLSFKTNALLKEKYKLILLFYRIKLKFTNS